MRSPDKDVIADADRVLAAKIAEIESTARVTVRQYGSHAWDLNPYQPAGVKLARAVAEELQYSHDEVMTVAGHDSTNMKDVVPTVLLFVPSAQGISHNLAEYTTDEDLQAGVAHADRRRRTPRRRRAAPGRGLTGCRTNGPVQRPPLT